MSTTTGKGNYANLFNPQLDRKSPYVGSLSFTSRTISFLGHILLLTNVSKFEKYGMKYIPRITIFHMVISAIIFLVSLKVPMPYGLILMVVFGGIILLGIKERLRPKLYGLTIELNSGTRHTIYSRDHEGIDKVFKTLLEAVNHPELYAMGGSFTFNNNGIIAGPVAMGAGAKAEMQ